MKLFAGGAMLPVSLFLLSVAAAGEAQPAPAGGCTPRTLPGEVICICRGATERGADPEQLQLLVDGRPAGPPAASAPGAVFFRLPPEIPLGEHEVAVAGVESLGTGACTLEVIRIRAQLDRERIWRGQGTPLRIQIEGTRRPVNLRLTNETPGVVRLQGGDEQVVSTSGGRRNSLERRVRGQTPGDFDLQYELLDATCPCGEFPGEGVFTEAPADTGEGEPPSATESRPGELQPTEPAATEPGVTEPGVTEPGVAEPGGTEPEPSQRQPTEPQPTETTASGETRPLPTPADHTTAPPGQPPEEPPTEPPTEPCASIGEEIERVRQRYADLTEEVAQEPFPRTTVVTPGPTGHEHCDRTYTTWARGATAVSIHRLMTQVRDLADFCLGHGTCTPEGHRAYMEELSDLAATVQTDARFTTLAEEMPALADSLVREYRYELDQARRALRQLEQTSPTGETEPTEGALHYRLRETGRQVRSRERSVEHMELWRRWSRELVSALENGSLLAPTPAPSPQETSP